MRVFHELSDEEIASLFHQRTLAVLAELREYDCFAVVGLYNGVEVLRVGRITVSTERFRVYDASGLLQGYYQSAARAVRKLMEKEEARWPKLSYMQDT